MREAVPVSTDAALSWVAFGIAAAVFALATATAIVFAGAPRRFARAGEAGNGDDPQDQQARPLGVRLNGRAVAVVTGATSALAVVAAALALASAIESATLTTAAALAVAGGSVTAGAVLYAALLGLLGAARSGRVRAALYPAAIAAQAVGSLPGLRAVAEAGISTAAETSNSHDTVTAVLGEELELLEAAGLDEGSTEARMIRAVLELDTARVREIMRPRVDMVAAATDSTVEEIVALMTEHGYSRIPIYEETIDGIVGVVHARDLLREGAAGNGAPPSVPDLARQALFVPESQKLEQLLREFQRARTQIAIVVDEYGGVSGLVTVEDFVEEIVGDLVDEFDRDEPEVRRVSEAEMIIDARLSLDTLKDEFGVEVEGEGFDTVGGLVYRELGKMPTTGDAVQVDGLSLTVESTVGRRIRRLRVRRAHAAPESAS